MKLDRKYETAKLNGFSKGIKFLYLMRLFTIFSPIAISNTFLQLYKSKIEYGISIPDVYWFAIFLSIIFFIGFCYGIWSVSEKGYYFVLTYIISMPIIKVLEYAILDEYFPYIELSTIDVISDVVSSIIISIIYYIYIKNRKFIFSIEREDFRIDLDFFVRAYKNDCKSIDEISKIYMIDKKSLQNNIDILKSKYGKCVQYKNYLISFSPFVMTDLSDTDNNQDYGERFEQRIVENDCVVQNEICSNEVQTKSDNSCEKKHSSNKTIWMIIAICVLSIISLVLAFSLISTYSNYNSEIEELNGIISSKNNKIDNLTGEIKRMQNSSAESDELIEQLEYIYDYKESMHTSLFHSCYNVIIVEEGETKEALLTCSYEGATVYSEQDNNNIKLKFGDEWIIDVITYKVTGLTKGCSTITFTNDVNDKKETVLVIVK